MIYGLVYNHKMDYTFPQYLLAKQTVDDRALNRQVYEKLAASLPAKDLRIIEVGAGVGTMLTRLLRWGLLGTADYIMVDEMAENIEFAKVWIPNWASENGLLVSWLSENDLQIQDDSRVVRVSFEIADVFDFIEKKTQPADLLIAHAFLDLLPLPESLSSLFSLLKETGLAWLTINFDGVTTFEPIINVDLDQKIERLYHQTMDVKNSKLRPTGGDSRTGRHLFGHLAGLGAQIIAAGSSDWVVYATDGKYPADEAYFLNFILYFFTTSLEGNAGLNSEIFAAWIAERQNQIERGELVYIAHQMDFLVKPLEG